MTFFQIIQDNQVVSAGCTFLKWNERRHKLYVCDPDEGQFVQSYDDQRVYTANWLKPAPASAGVYETAKVEIISEEAYNDLVSLLRDGEPVELEEPATEPVVQHEETEEEKPMSIAQMREIITEQQKQIEMLMNKVMN